MPLSFFQRFFEKRKRSTNPLSLSGATVQVVPKDDVRREAPDGDEPSAEPVAKRKSLFAFVDLKDPFAPGEIEGEEVVGPILSILSAKEFDSVFLLYTSQTYEKASETCCAAWE